MKDKDQIHLIRAYVEKGFKKVEGWATPILFEKVMQIDAFQKALGVTGHIGEIGVHHGKLFILMYLLRRADENGIAIDIFEQQELNFDKSGSGDRSIFVENIRVLGGGDSSLKILAGDSTGISGADVSECAGGRLRLLSIDGGHLKQIVAHDLKTATQCLAEGGIVLVDDYLNPEFPGVAEGTLSFLSKNSSLRPFCVSTQKLYLTTKGYEHKYAKLLYESETGKLYDKRIKHSFVPGRHCAVRTADLLDTEVICYSDDFYSRSHQVRRRIRGLKHRAREKISETSMWKRLRESRSGDFLRYIADRIISNR